MENWNGVWERHRRLICNYHSEFVGSSMYLIWCVDLEMVMMSFWDCQAPGCLLTSQQCAGYGSAQSSAHIKLLLFCNPPGVLYTFSL